MTKNNINQEPEHPIYEISKAADPAYASKTTQEEPKPEEWIKSSYFPNGVVVFIHGMRSKGPWIEDFKKNLGEDIISINVPFRVLWFPRFFMQILLFRNDDKIVNYVHHKILRGFLDNRFDTTGENPPHISIIAHSYGTYIASLLHRKYKDFDIVNMVLFASIIKSNHDWTGRSGKKPKIINIIGTRDCIVRLASLGSRQFGNSGIWGFDKSTHVNNYMVKTDHNNILKINIHNFCRDVILCKIYPFDIVKSGDYISSDKTINELDGTQCKYNHSCTDLIDAPFLLITPVVFIIKLLTIYPIKILYSFLVKPLLDRYGITYKVEVD